MLHVFDFDGTLTADHLSGYEISQVANMGETLIDRRLLGKLWSTLIHAGHKVAVASFGRRDIIELSLGHLRKLVTISTPKDFGYQDNTVALGNKNRQLQRLTRLLGVSPADTILYDDNASNIRAALGAGYKAVHCPRGLRPDIMVNLIQGAARPQ